MKLVAIESRVLGYDIAESWGAAGGPPETPSSWYEVSLDTFLTDEGIAGYTMQGANLTDGGAMAQVLHDLYAPQLIGEDPLATERLWHKLRRLNRHAYNLSDASAGAIDVALWDIRGKAANLPIAALLGVARTRIGTYCTARNLDPTPEEVHEEARLRKSEGYHAFKIQFRDGLARDVPRFRAARDAVGADYPLLEDAAGEYSYVEALGAGELLADLGFLWFEEPIPDRNLSTLKRLTDQLSVPVLAGETLRLHELAEAMRMGAFDIARGDVLLKEGITGLRKAAAMAELLGLDIEIHSLNQPLLDVANLHVALSIENCRWSENGYHPIYHRGLLNSPLDIDADGYRYLPSGPGLGVELDWAWIDNATQRVLRTPAHS